MAALRPMTRQERLKALLSLAARLAPPARMPAPAK
jgi:hypothetical protein